MLLGSLLFFEGRKDGGREKSDLSIVQHGKQRFLESFILIIFIAESESFMISATPYSPFAADKSPKNLGYLGRGYDVLYGDPLDEAGRVDPGNYEESIGSQFRPQSFYWQACAVIMAIGQCFNAFVNCFCV